MNKRELKKFFQSKDYTPSTFKQIRKILNITEPEEVENLRNLISELVEEGFLFRDLDGKYEYSKKNLYKGVIEFTRSGNLAFVQLADGTEIAVPVEKVGPAMHKDVVEVQIVGKWYELPEGRVTKVVERGIKQLVGVFQKDRFGSFVIPDDPKIPHVFYVPEDKINGAQPGLKVVAKIIGYPSQVKKAKAEIVQVLGGVDDPATDFPTVVIKHSLPVEFPDEVLKEVAQFKDYVSEEDLEGRKDFRDEVIVTIDGPDAKDFDDAVHVKKLKNGNYLLGVHIADVSHYVKEGTALDDEAYKRGTSVYLADRVIPMLPFKLSNGLCSLVQGEDRLVMSLLMEIDKNGDVVKQNVYNGVIRSYRRLIYDEVNLMLEGNKEMKKKLGDLEEQILLMKELKNVLRENRHRRGAILDIESDEVKIILDEKGHAVDIVPRKRGESEKIIEEFMIKANESVAEIFNKKNIPFIYRVHEQPDYDTLFQLKNYLAVIGIKMRIGQEIHPSLLQEILERTADHPLRSSIQRLLVRAMKRAVYSPENIGHFGLASSAYTHFTSPIRRYPDLMVHRLLKRYLEDGGKMKKREEQKLLKYLTEASSHCSKRERVADESEWDYEALKKVDYISNYVGEVFDAVITSVTKFGFFAEIQDKYISGLVHVSSLNDYFYYDDYKNMLVGKRTGKVYKIGDLVKVKVVNADKIKMEINFEVVEEEKKKKSKEKSEKKTEKVEKKKSRKKGGKR